MSRLNVLRALLAVWVVWHLAFGALSTFWPEVGANSIGWSAEGGWSDPLLAMSTQYGMVMVLLAAMYAFMLLEPLRYLGLIWVAVGEQALGIVYALYIYATMGQITPTQMGIQAAINVIIMLLFVLLWSGLKSQAPHAKAA
ncbi:MAG: hypothetical protein U5L06_14885 [Rhodovibrio sp.]|nr:hypothetical protein [Rhodovibrio sp.]